MSRVHKGRPCTDQCNHGSASTYGNHGCRCQSCRAANATWMASYRERNAEARRNDPATPHGHLTTYTQWNCRCYPCTIARRDYDAARKAKACSTAS